MNFVKNEEQLANDMLNKISLVKDKEAMKGNVVELSKAVVNLSKEKNFDLTGLTSQVVLVLDHSGSMSREYKSGAVQEVVTKLIPLGLNFDDNGEIEVFRFDNRAKQVKPSLTINNYSNYVDKHVFDYNDMGGTCYAKPLELIYEEYVGGKPASGGFLSRLTGKANTAVSNTGAPVYVLFVTDGANSDERDTTNILNELIKKNVFVQFVGVGSDSFRYLKKADNEMLGVSFIQFKDIKSMTAAGVYGQILDEFTEWLAKRA